MWAIVILQHVPFDGTSFVHKLKAPMQSVPYRWFLGKLLVHWHFNKKNKPFVVVCLTIEVYYNDLLY